MTTSRTPASERILINVTPTQAEHIRRACEFYARVINGQFSEIAWECGFNYSPTTHATIDYDQALELLYQARALLFPELGASQGIHWGVGRNARSDATWDVHTVLRHEMWKHDRPGDDPESYCHVASHPPLHWGDEPLCTAKYVKQGE